MITTKPYISVIICYADIPLRHLLCRYSVASFVMQIFRNVIFYADIRNIICYGDIRNVICYADIP